MSFILMSRRCVILACVRCRIPCNSNISNEYQRVSKNETILLEKGSLEKCLHINYRV